MGSIRIVPSSPPMRTGTTCHIVDSGDDHVSGALPVSGRDGAPSPAPETGMFSSSAPSIAEGRTDKSFSEDVRAGNLGVLSLHLTDRQGIETRI